MQRPNFIQPAAALGCLLVAILMCQAAHAVPYTGQQFQYHQPDGSSFTVQLFGDEFFAYQRTLDGREVILDASGFWCYAQLAADGRSFKSTGIPVVTRAPGSQAFNQNLAIRSAAKPNMTLPDDVVLERVHATQAARGLDERGRVIRKPAAGQAGAIMEEPHPLSTYPSTTGDIVGLTLLVDFPDEPGTITPAQVDRFCNQPSGYTEFGNSCSVNEYFRIQSNGKLNYNNTVTAYIRMPKPKTYYDNNSAYAPVGELVTAAINALMAQGFDFTQLTLDGSGYIKSINIYYAGTCASGWSLGLWPHSSGISTIVVDQTHNIKASSYQMSDMGEKLYIGTFCHENVHMTCDLPDLYSYVNSSSIVGFYSLMGDGCWGGNGSHPTNIDAYLKYVAGWSDVVEVNSDSHLNGFAQEDRNYFLKYTNPADSTEYFIIENRNNAGYEGPYGGDPSSVVSGRGLAVWHAFEYGSNAYSSIQRYGTYTMPYEAFVIEATPTTSYAPWYLYASPRPNDLDTFFAGQGANPLNDVTVPELKFWDMTTAHSGRTVASGFTLHGFGGRGTAVGYTVGSGSPPATPAIGATTLGITANCDFGSSPTSQTIHIYNAAGGTLTYTVTDNAAWVSCTPTADTLTTGTTPITVTIDPAGLASGAHSAYITVTAAGASNTPFSIPVTLNVAQPAAVAVSGAAINETLLPGESSASHGFWVSNSGGGLLSYTIGSSAAWISTSVNSGSCCNESDLIDAAANLPYAIAAGTYAENIQVSAATGAPQTIPMTVTVRPGIYVAVPRHGDYWMAGKTKTIRWGCNVGDNVKIELLKGGALNRVIVASTPNTGSYEWPIPADVPEGADYKVRVSTTSGSYTNTSATAFWVLDPAGPYQTQMWTWMKGPSESNHAGVYGTQGVAASANNPGGREYAAVWATADSRLWLFGGDGFDAAGNSGHLNDLWRYDPATGNWTWIKGTTSRDQLGVYGTKGTPAPTNLPGGREEAVTWVDSSGALWLFGGYGWDVSYQAYLNDLWKYDPATNQWTWVSGSNYRNQFGNYGTMRTASSTNRPGARYGATGWIDGAGSLWLFGGYGYTATTTGFLNDLWKYDPVTNQWTWMHGSSAISQRPTFGTKGVADPANMPGGRKEVGSWKSAGAFWLLGGDGFDGAGSWNEMNDLWKFDTATLNWTWMKGSTTSGQTSIHGASGVFDPSFTVGSRMWGSSCTDSSGAFWFFGGMGRGASYDTSFNDLWKFDPASGNWAWFRGNTNNGGSYGVYGTLLGPTTIDITPGLREGAVMWPGTSGAKWLFGGSGLGAETSGLLGDLWKCDNGQYDLRTVMFVTDGTPGSGFIGKAAQAVPKFHDSAPVTANPPASHHFVKWTKGGAEFSTSRTLTIANVLDDTTVTAVFAINSYQLIYAAGAHGTISGTASQTVIHGASGTAVTAIPAGGFHFLCWSDGSTANPRTDANVTGNVNVTALFSTYFSPVYVQFGFAGVQEGTPTNPFAALGTGVLAVTSGGTVRVAAGSAPTAIRITKPMRLESTGGTATIGK